MLDPAQIDLRDLAEALQDHSQDHEWWLDPSSGDVELWSDLVREVDDEHPGERGLLLVEPVPSHDAYEDMVDFAALVADRDLARRLDRALTGRGPFRRFKDELHQHADERADWHRFSSARMARRAAEWLAERGLITPDARDALAAAHPDPTPEARTTGRTRLAAAVARDLRGLFGDRLREVRMYGSSARGDEDPESDLDLLVVLSGPVDVWRERARMDDVLWRHTLDSGILVSALPVSADDTGSAARPALVRAVSEGVAVG